MVCLTEYSFMIELNQDKGATNLVLLIYTYSPGSTMMPSTKMANGARVTVYTVDHRYFIPNSVAQAYEIMFYSILHKMLLSSFYLLFSIRCFQQYVSLSMSAYHGIFRFIFNSTSTFIIRPTPILKIYSNNSTFICYTKGLNYYQEKTSFTMNKNQVLLTSF